MMQKQELMGLVQTVAKFESIDSITVECDEGGASCLIDFEGDTFTHGTISEVIAHLRGFIRGVMSASVELQHRVEVAGLPDEWSAPVRFNPQDEQS